MVLFLDWICVPAGLELVNQVDADGQPFLTILIAASPCAQVSPAAAGDHAQNVVAALQVAHLDTATWTTPAPRSRPTNPPHAASPRGSPTNGQASMLSRRGAVSDRRR